MPIHEVQYREHPKRKLVEPLSRASFFSISIIIYILLTYAYITYVSPIFFSQQFTTEYSNIKFAYGLTAIFITCMTSANMGIGIYFTGFLVLFLLIPSSVYYAAGPGTNEYFIIKILAILIVLTVVRFTSIPIPRFSSFRYKNMTPLVLLLLVSYFSALVLQGGLNFINFDIDKVYEFRSDAAANLLPIFGYITPTVSKVAIPALIALSMKRNQYLLTALALVMGVLLFGFTGHKSYLFYGFCSFFIYLIYQKSARIILYMCLGMITFILYSMYELHLVLLSGLEFNQQSNGTFGSLFLRRVLFVPAQLDGLWIQFFSENPKLFWSDSRLTLGFLVSPYELKAPYLIGNEIFKKPGLAANTGWVGSGYSQAGTFGVIIYSILLGLTLSFLKKASERLGEGFIAAVSFPLLFTIFLSTDFLTSLLTHGLAVLLIFIATLYHSPDLPPINRVIPPKNNGVSK